MCISIISLSKATHQMWHDHPFSQRTRETKRAVVVEAKGGVRQNMKKGSRQYREIFGK